MVEYPKYPFRQFVITTLFGLPNTLTYCPHSIKIIIIIIIQKSHYLSLEALQDVRNYVANGLQFGRDEHGAIKRPANRDDRDD